MKLRGLFIGLLLAGAADAFLAPAVARCAGLRFVAPRPNQVVGGDNVILWAAETPVPPARGAQPKERQVVFEASTDNRTFLPLPRQSAPDFGLFSQTSAFDTAGFPSGLLFLRVRYVDQPKGPTIRVRVNRLPVVDCTAASEIPPAYTVFFDCTGSRDPDGRIIRYLWRFGDGTSLETDKPLALHTFASSGTYSFEVTAFDDRGLSSTLIRLVTVSTGLPGLVPPAKCGCKNMVVRAATGSKSTLKDLRRKGNAIAPLGKDPDFVSFNFEVEVELEAGSDPKLCREGQLAKGTATITRGNGRTREHKRACAKGRPLTSCEEDAECDHRLCTTDLKPCEDYDSFVACLKGGGRCPGLGDGVCREFPFKGVTRGNDGYQRRSDVKEYGPGAKIRWLDTPGPPSPRSVINYQYKLEADFLSFVDGLNDGGDCQCHIQMNIDWDGEKQKYGDATGITLMQTSANCSVVN